jgi:hypothetical protein
MKYRKKPSLIEIFKQFKTDANFDMTIDEAFAKKPKTMAEKYEKAYGFKPVPSIYHPVTVKWTAKGTGFGEFTFYSVDGKLHCQNEMMSKDFLKVMLCLIVDKATLDDPPVKNKKGYKNDRKY